MRSPSSAIPIEKWSPRALELLDLRREGDRGIGDTILAILGPFDEKLLRIEFKKLIPGQCKCSNMQDELNRRFPYPV